MEKIVFIIPYFGKFPNYIDLFLKSCSYNKDIDWLFVTDNDLDVSYPNIHILDWSFEQLKEQISKKLKIEDPIPAPYKLCDYRPAYGEIFADYLTEYDFWGHCDLDLIYGDVSKYIRKAPLEEYDRIFTFGHMTLYRNTEKVNRYYQLSGKKDTDFYYCIRYPEPMYFDEVGMNRLLDQHQIPQYKHPEFADIWPQSASFKNRIFQEDKNYKGQYFIWQEGKVFKVWQENDEIKKKEYSYIHLQRRSLPQYDSKILKESAYAITPHGFFSLNELSFKKHLKPNYEHAFLYYKKRYSTITPKKIRRKIQLFLLNETQESKNNKKGNKINGKQKTVG